MSGLPPACDLTSSQAGAVLRGDRRLDAIQKQNARSDRFLDQGRIESAALDDAHGGKVESTLLSADVPVELVGARIALAGDMAKPCRVENR